MLKLLSFSKIALLLTVITLICSCASLKPTPSPQFPAANIQKVADGGIIAASGMFKCAIAPNGLRLARPGMNGDIFVSNLDKSGQQLIYDKTTDPDIESMPAMNARSSLERYSQATDQLLSFIDDNSLEGVSPILNKFINPQKIALEVQLKGVTYAMELANQKHIADLAWSPDAKKLAAVIVEPWSYKTVVTVFDLENRTKKVIRKFYPPFNPDHYLSGIVKSPQVSKDVSYACGVSWKSNDTIVYSYFAGENYILIANHLKSGNETILALNTIIRAYFSDDGSHVAYFIPAGSRSGSSSKTALENHFSQLELRVAASDFSNAKTISRGFKFNRRAAWSPDGQKLVFANEDSMVHWTKSTLSFHDVKSHKTIPICGKADINSPTFIDKNMVYFMIMDNYVFKVRIP